MKLSDIADTCAKAIADPGAISNATSIKPPVFFDGCRAPAAQVCAAVWLPWNWADLPDQELFYGYLWSACRSVMDKVPEGAEPSPEPLHVPEGVDAAFAQHGRASVRIVVMEHPVPTRELVEQLGARALPWYNPDLDQTETRAVVPLLRLDMRVQPKEKNDE